MNTDDVYLTIKETAKILKVSVSCIIGEAIKHSIFHR